jgi:acyl carrier protein
VDYDAVSEAMLFEVMEAAADVFGVPRSSLSPASSPLEIEAWDSIQNVNLVLSLEQRFSIQFAPEDLERMNTIGEIAEILAKKLGRPV